MTPNEIRAAREALGLSVAELAAVMGFASPYSLKSIEDRDRSPSPRVVRLLRAYIAGYRPAGWLTQPVLTMTPDELRVARKRLGLSQAELAAVMGYTSRTTIRQIEAGKAEPNPGTVPLLRAYLDGYRPADWPEPQEGRVDL